MHSNLYKNLERKLLEPTKPRQKVLQLLLLLVPSGAFEKVSESLFYIGSLPKVISVRQNISSPVSSRVKSSSAGVFVLPLIPTTLLQPLGSGLETI
jgi:hypothetical protein